MCTPWFSRRNAASSALGGVGDTQQQGGGEAFALLPCAALGQQADHRQADGQHHDAGGGIAHPHADKGGGDHEAGNLPARLVADCQQRGQRDALVQVPALHRQTEQETTEEQEDRRVGIGGGGLGEAVDAQQRNQQDRQQRGGRNRDGFGRPPDGHHGGHADGAPGRFR